MILCFFFLFGRPPRDTQRRSSAASDGYKRETRERERERERELRVRDTRNKESNEIDLSHIYISERKRQAENS